MQVKLRHIDGAKAVPFTNCRHDELNDVIALVKQSGGVWVDDTLPFHSYQLVMDETESWAEIIIGCEDADSSG